MWIVIPTIPHSITINATCLALYRARKTHSLLKTMNNNRSQASRLRNHPTLHIVRHSESSIEHKQKNNTIWKLPISASDNTTRHCSSGADNRATALQHPRTIAAAAANKQVVITAGIFRHPRERELISDISHSIHSGGKETCRSAPHDTGFLPNSCVRAALHRGGTRQSWSIDPQHHVGRGPPIL